MRKLRQREIKELAHGLPWWRSGWESACQCRGHGSEPWSGKIPHAAEQLGPWATITEPARLEPVLRNKRGCDSERPAHRNEEWSPLAATRGSPRTETKTQHSQKKKKKIDLVSRTSSLKKKELAQIHETSVWQSLEFILGLTLEPVFSSFHSSTFPGWAKCLTEQYCLKCHYVMVKDWLQHEK